MIIKALIMKDYYEYKNNFLKFGGPAIFVICLPVYMFNFMGVSTLLFTDLNKFTELIAILYTTILLGETTMYQIRRNIRDGIYEKYFINKNIKKYQIYLSKLFTNLVIVLISFVTMYFLNVSVGHFVKDSIQFSISFDLIIQLIITCSIGTSLAFISSLVIADEKNAVAYMSLLIVVYLGYYKILEILSIKNYAIEIFGLVLIACLLVLFVLVLLQKNRFIRR